MNNTSTSNRPSKCALMRRIMELGFYIDDIGLYLDTHPDDCRSLARYHEIHHEYDTAVQNYSEWYGPLNKYHVTCNSRFDWIDGPWPWEGGME